MNDATGLTGIIKLVAQSPIDISGEVREVNGVLRTVGVIRLVQPPASVAGTQQPNVFETFSGGCGQRPETGTCFGPGPIEYINAVTPDCNGNILIELRGLLKLGSIANDNSSVIIDTTVGLKDICLPKNLPDSKGALPNSYPDLCESDGVGLSQYESCYEHIAK